MKKSRTVQESIIHWTINQMFSSLIIKNPKVITNKVLALQSDLWVIMFKMLISQLLERVLD
jgi:hypothetical protein